MQLVVMNREAVEQGAIMDLQESVSPRTLLVAVASIVDKGAAREARVLCHNYSCVGIERFMFDDDDTGPNALTQEDALRAVRFLQAMEAKNVALMVIHCEAGISRSAGMAGAFAIVLGQSDEQFFQPPYNPNMKVYRSVLNAWVQLRK